MKAQMKMVDDYLDGILSATEEKDFLKTVDEDDTLSDELHFQQEVRESIHDEGFAKLRNALMKESATIENEPRHIVFHSRKDKNVVYAIAATIALLIASGLLYIFLNGQLVKPEQLAEKYYHPAQSIQHLRSLEESDLMGANEAFDFYNNGDYAQALTRFSTIENKVVSAFYSGICYYELKNYQEAERSFQFIINHKRNLFYEQAEWYLALTYLKTDKVTQAKEILSQMSQKDSPFSEQSLEILEKLD